MDWLSLLVPFAYLGILLTSLATFSSLYRKRKARKSLSLSPYFPPHTPRNIYLSLLHLQDHDDPSTTTRTTTTKVPESLLRAALLARCTEDIHRIIHIRTRKQALNTLLKRGCVGDEIWQRLLRAELELEAEVKDCVQEANALSPNWGTTIFQSANEMANNDMLKNRLEAVFGSMPQEKQTWEARRQTMRDGFLRELELEQKQEQGSAAAGVESGRGKDKEKEAIVAARGSSDEDAVMVEKEKGGDAAPSSSSSTLPTATSGGGGGGGGGGGKSKKKKSGKK